MVVVKMPGRINLQFYGNIKLDNMLSKIQDISTILTTLNGKTFRFFPWHGYQPLQFYYNFKTCLKKQPLEPNKAR